MQHKLSRTNTEKNEVHPSTALRTNSRLSVHRGELSHSYFLFSLFTIYFSLNSSVLPQTDVYLEVYTKTFQRMEIDLYPMNSEIPSRDAAAVSEMITAVLSNDLWMSGYFKVNVQSGVPPAIASGSNHGLNAFAWVAGKFRVEGSQVSIQPQVVDRGSGRTILRNDYTGQLEKQRYLVHKIADDIVYNLTGERGIARSKVTYVNQKKDGSKEIALMDYDGHNARDLTSNKSINLSPAWSPDGSKICYTSYKDGNPDLYVLHLQSNLQSRISSARGLNSAPAWSPDGRSIALTLTRDGNAEIYLLEVENKMLKRLTFNRAIDCSPSWSPSNRELAFTSDRSGSPQIYIMDSDGLNVRRLTFEGNYNDSPSWSPHGDKIAFASRTDTGFDIYTIDVTGENLMRLTDSSGSNEDPCWSPNGFALIFSSTRSGRKALYSMFWDGSDQKELPSSGVNYLPAWSPRLN
jgi:TolB protein